MHKKRFSSNNNMPSHVKQQPRNVLVVCDMQPDLLNSIVPASRRDAFVQLVHTAIDVARTNNWKVVFTGVQFSSGYAAVSPQHKIYGDFRRLNDKLGDAHAHCFLEGYAGSEIELSLFDEALGDRVIGDNNTYRLKNSLMRYWRRSMSRIATTSIRQVL